MRICPNRSLEAIWRSGPIGTDGRDCIPRSTLTVYAIQTLFIFICFASAAGAQKQEAEDTAAADRRLALHVKLDREPITPAVARFLGRALDEARIGRAECLIIELDTPGGLVESTREIVKAMLASPTAVVVYVAPSGARAASAGVFITLAAHVAAMAPGTTIGAAHPVSVGGLPMGPPEPGAPTRPPTPSPAGEDQPTTPTTIPIGSIMEQKILHDTVAWVRALAQLRGRNAEWAARAVTESVSATASEALDLKVVDLIAKDVRSLLEQIDGREVTLQDETRALKTKDAEVRPFEMWWGERLLATISNPNVAFLLLMFGFYGILFEFYSPGWGVAGTLGLICLLLAFFGLSVLPINYLGLALIIVAFGMFVAEAFVTSFGALALGGIACLILGAVMLVDSPMGFMRISMAVVVPVAAATGVIAVILISGVVRAFRARVQTGTEGMRAETAVAQDAFSAEAGNYTGTVLVHGELWRALSPTPVSGGQQLTITGRDGLTLSVEASQSAAGEQRE